MNMRRHAVAQPPVQNSTISVVSSEGCDSSHIFFLLFWIIYLVSYVYILLLSNRTYYIGFSSDLRRRVQAHNDGEVSQSKNLLPIRLVFNAAFQSKEKSLAFEKYLKSGSGFAFRNRHFV